MEITKKGSPPVPLYYKLKEDIRSKISSDEYPVGSVIPGEFQLMEAYGVSRTTVVKAISELVNEGLLQRKHGKGTFVCRPEKRFSAKQIIGIAMVTHGHLYGPLAARIVSNLKEHEYYCLTVEVAEDDRNYARLRSLVEKNPAFLVVDGNDFLPFEALENYRGRTIFVFRNEGEEINLGDNILSDYYRGGELVADYLVSMGHERLVYISHTVRKKQKTLQAMIKGVSDTLARNGLPSENLKFCPYPKDKRKISDLLKKEQKPLAVFCSEDFLAKAVYSICRELGLSIPRDVSVVGYYNTPWSEIFYPRLTSVSIREDELADIVSDLIIKRRKGKVNISLEPELIVRESVLRIGGN